MVDITSKYEQKMIWHKLRCPWRRARW